MIIITGDIHNDFDSLNSLINKNDPEMVICCGDFGYWPRIADMKKLSDIKSKNSKILWCDGNHDDHWSLKNRESDELVPNVIYMPRGSTYALPDGRTILFMGGADSIDKHLRIEGIDWFREEIINQKDFFNLPDKSTKIDIIISHTCPKELVNEMTKNIKSFEPSNEALSNIWDLYKPSLWFFGHWHHSAEITMKGTKFFALGCPQYNKKWWTIL